MKYLFSLACLLLLVSNVQADIRGDASVACIQAHQAKASCEQSEYEADGHWLNYCNKRDEARNLYNAEPEGPRKEQATLYYNGAISFGSTGYGKWLEARDIRDEAQDDLGEGDNYYMQGEMDFADGLSTYTHWFELSIGKHIWARNQYNVSKAYYDEASYELGESVWHYEQVIGILQAEM